MPRRRVSKRVEVRPGGAALAPKVDDPLGFALQNESGGPLTVTFNFDTTTHVMTVVVEERRPSRRPPGEADRSWNEQPTGDLPV